MNLCTSSLPPTFLFSGLGGRWCLTVSPFSSSWKAFWWRLCVNVSKKYFRLLPPLLLVQKWNNNPPHSAFVTFKQAGEVQQSRIKGLMSVKWSVVVGFFLIHYGHLVLLDLVTQSLPALFYTFLILIKPFWLTNSFFPLFFSLISLIFSLYFSKLISLNAKLILKTSIVWVSAQGKPRWPCSLQSVLRR